MMRIFAFIVFSFLLSSFQYQPKPDVKYQLLVFEGSDWCTSCAYFSKQVLERDSFQDFLQEKQVELIRVDFPQRILLSKQQKARNAILAEKYNFLGEFPTLILVDLDSESFEKMTYRKQNQKDFQKNLLDVLKQLEE